MYHLSFVILWVLLFSHLKLQSLLYLNATVWYLLKCTTIFKYYFHHGVIYLKSVIKGHHVFKDMTYISSLLKNLSIKKEDQNKHMPCASVDHDFSDETEVAASERIVRYVPREHPK